MTEIMSYQDLFKYFYDRYGIIVNNLNLKGKDFDGNIYTLSEEERSYILQGLNKIYRHIYGFYFIKTKTNFYSLDIQPHQQTIVFKKARLKDVIKWVDIINN